MKINVAQDFLVDLILVSDITYETSRVFAEAG